MKQGMTETSRQTVVTREKHISCLKKKIFCRKHLYVDISYRE